MSPIDTTAEKPMPREAAQSSTPPTSAPDCDRKASLPGAGRAMPKLALRPMPGTHSPNELGPMMRRQLGRAAFSMACRSSGPRPAVMTSAARVPFAPNAPTSAGMVLGGVTITASSGTSGRSSMLAKHFRPPITLCFGLTR